jgi:hypothetical protein
MSSAHATALIVIVPIRHPIFEFSYEVDLQCIICIIQHLIILPVSINQDDMPTVEKSAHLGILRSKSNQKTENSQIEQNITKARRTAYSLLSTGFYGKNGCLHFKVPYLTVPLSL